MELLDSGVTLTLAKAHRIIRYCGHPYIDTDHLFLALLNQPGTINRAILRKLGVDVGVLRQRVLTVLGDWQPATVSGQNVHHISKLKALHISMTQRVVHVLENAEQEADRLQDPYTEVEHIFLAIINEAGLAAARLASEAGIRRDSFMETLLQLRRQQDSSGRHFVCQTTFWGPNGILRGLFHYPKTKQPLSKGHFRWPEDQQSKQPDCFPAVVLLHGFSGHHVEDHRLYVQFARMLGDAGFCVLRFDFFGSGDSNGSFDQFTPLTEVDDAVAALDWVSEQNIVDPNRIGVVGLSLGGGVTALLAGQDPRVKAVVFWNSVARPTVHFDEIPTEGPMRGVVGGLRIGPEFVPTFKAQDFLGSLDHYTGPGLVVWGTADEFISRADADALYAALGERGTLHLVEGADHTFRRPDWRQELFEVTSRWLADHLK